MKKRTTVPNSDHGGGRERAEALIAECLSGDSTLDSRSVEAMCAAHPDLANELRAVAANWHSSDDALRGVTPLEHPRQLGPYRLLHQLGSGGMGVVWLADQTEPVRRRVAIKLIKAGMDTKEVLARFEAERQALALMNHPNIAKVLDAGATSDGRPFFALEHVKGVPITEYCDLQRLGIRERVELLRLVCMGAHHAHQKGVIHRDLKPSNILIETPDGKPTPRIIDFGVAKAIDHRLVQQTLFTEHGRAIGTPEYMSPEQAEMTGLNVDIRTDVYSLGVLLYELLTGTLPLVSSTLRAGGLHELHRRIREDEPVRPSTRVTSDRTELEHARKRSAQPQQLARALRGELDWITMRCLEKDPARRYASASELAADLQRYLQHEPVDAGPPSATYRIRKFLRKRRALVASIGLIFLALTAGLAVALWQFRVAEKRLAAYLEMRDFPLVESLLDEAKDLWPATGDKLASMDDWLARARELAPRLGRHQNRLAAIPVDSEDPEHRFLRTVLTNLVGMSRRLTDEGGVLGEVAARRERAATLRSRSVESADAAARWRTAIERIRASDRYGNLDLDAQLGLLPLGPDPDSGLEEFAVVDSGSAPERTGAGRLTFGKTSAIVLVLIPGGTFQMGAQSKDPSGANYDANAESDEGPVTDVTLRPFFLGKYEVTQAQWQLLMAKNPSTFTPGMEHYGRLIGATNPVETTDWQSCVDALNRVALVLPSEAQWEYAHRAGTTTPWWSGGKKTDLNGVANVADRTMLNRNKMKGGKGEPEIVDGHVFHSPVGSFRPNAFGLHDTAGNNFEWCLDTYNDRAYELAEPRPSDGLRVFSGDFRVIRGGSWFFDATQARSAFRAGLRVATRFDTLGLRAARPLR